MIGRSLLVCALLLTGCATTSAPRRASTANSLDPEVLSLFVQAQSVLRQPTDAPAVRAEQAASLLQEAIARAPEAPQLWRFLAEAWSQVPDHPAAIAAAGRAVELDPGNVRGWQLLGQSQYRLQEHEAAVIALRRAVALEGADYLPHYYLQAALRELGRHDEAVQALDGWATALPADTNPRSMQAELLWDLGRADEAAAAALEAVRQDRSNDDALRIFVRAHRLDPGAAADAIEDVLRADWSAALLHRQLVDQYERIGRYDDALDHLGTVGTLEPASAGTLELRRVDLLLQAHRAADALPAIEAAIDDAETSADARADWLLRLAAARQALGQDAAARAALEPLVPDGPRAVLAARRLAALVGAERPADGLDVLAPLLEPPRSPTEELLRDAVRFALAARDWERAEQHLEQLARRSPREATLVRAELLQARDDLEGAIRLLAPSAADHPDDLWMASRLADLLVADGRPRDAAGVLTASMGAVAERTATRVARAAGAARFEAEQDGVVDRVWLLLRRSWAEQQAEDYAASEATLRQARALQPAHPDVLNGLGYLLAVHGTDEQLVEAEQLLLLATGQQPFSGAYLDSLGVVYLRQGRHEDSLRLLEQAAAWVPDSAEVLEHLGDAYRAAGDAARARATYRRIVDLGPKLSEAEQPVLPRATDKLRRLESTAAD